ncbi:AzlC family ABC transporter permease [Tepidanaerobacter syntrophicus]|uniref:AzlC family ABC transporter permease n=1 Tax=Tepidanaerobacter syntrophicus TaxID=224999 RepID=UPI002357E4D1|nr:AzlC family ABC transporter permease [Tepidanaerobacter syntrophicus]
MKTVMQQSKEKNDLIFGIKRAIPIVFGYIPVGFAMGVTASNTGLTPFETGLMSVFVYAGSAQFVAIDMIRSNASFIAIIITTFLVNLRHLLFSASLAPHFQHIKQKLILIISFFITDESFAVSITDAEQGFLSHSYYLGLYITAYLSWILSTVIGAAFGNLIPNTKALGFDFALPGMFLALLCMQLKNIKFIFVSLISGLLSIILIYLMPGNWNVILAAVIAAVIGVFIDDED